MSRSEFETRIASVAWATLRGAYGASDGSAFAESRTRGGDTVRTVLGNVPAALKALATVRDAESDEWGEAMDVVWSHVLHQGDVHEVTPVVVPFLFDLLELEKPPVARPREIALALAHVAASAHRDLGAEAPAAREIAAVIVNAIAARVDSLKAWTPRRLGEYALSIATQIPSLREPIFAALASRRDWPFYAYVACAELETAPEGSIPRAERALDSDDSRVVLAAAALLARRSNPSPALASRIDAALPPNAAAQLKEALEAPFTVVVVRPRVTFTGTLTPATVLFVGPTLVVANYAPGKNAQVRWANAPIAKGATIQLGLSPHHEVRVVEFTRDDGSVERVEFKH